MAEVKDLVVAEIDMNANEVEDIAIKEYPTIMFYGKQSKTGIEY